MTNVLGISAYYHDSAAILLVDGIVISAAQEERFTRKKHDATFPKNAIFYVLSEGGLTLEKIDYVVFYDKPFLTFERLLETYIAFAPKKGLKSFSVSMPTWLKKKLFLKSMLNKSLKEISVDYNQKNLLFSEHHLSHAASAFYPSNYDEAVILVVDGVGEWATTTVAIGKGNSIEIIKEIYFPHSLGLLYSAFTYYLGFKVNSGEYKVMGLAPYGKPRFKEIILNKLMDLKDDGSFRLDQSYFDYAVGLVMTSKKFSKLFGENVRDPVVNELTQFHMDIAASIQEVLEIILLKITRTLKKQYQIPNLCLAGGVALNCVANSRILDDPDNFKNIWVQPAAGDAGGALGAALYAWHSEFKKPRTIVPSRDLMNGGYLGPSYKDHMIRKKLIALGAVFIEYSEPQLLDITSTGLVSGNVIGWFQGRMEYGPRALGNRSILGDPRSSKMQKVLNKKIKYRESFRPFAPAILKEDLTEWFSMTIDSPYMLFCANIKKDKVLPEFYTGNTKTGFEQLHSVRSKVPAVTHVNLSARIQTVHKETNPLFYALISDFKNKTGCPMLINTSFNIRGEPMVCSPEEAFKCFMGTDMDMLVIGNFILKKEKQNMKNLINYRDDYGDD